jgi:hypothetical protein
MIFCCFEWVKKFTTKAQRAQTLILRLPALSLRPWCLGGGSNQSSKITMIPIYFSAFLNDAQIHYSQVADIKNVTQ